MVKAKRLVQTRAFLRDEDVDLIQEVAARLADAKETNVVNLGAGGGTTALAVKEALPLCNLTTVDISKANLVETEIQLDDAGFDRHSWVEGDAAAMASLFPPESIDFVMLDTSHTYEATVAELAAWLPRLRHGGLLWCHDYIAMDAAYGVDKAIDPLVADGTLETIEVRGLGWAGIKK